MDIIRDLRLGEFDALIGINLLREGLDIPEVSLVAVLDADKEGFLRSTRSLIQTVGRAARNVEGKAIFYADKITDSMRQTMDETARRREIQDKYNKDHGIEPKQIKKKIVDVMEVALAHSDAFKVPYEERSMPTKTRAQWENEREVDTLQGTKRGYQGDKAAAKLKDQKPMDTAAATAKAASKMSIEALGKSVTADEEKARVMSLLIAFVQREQGITISPAVASALRELGNISLGDLMNNLASHRRLPSADALVKEVERIQKEMLELVHELKFEEAAVLRDRMKAIDHILLLLPGRD